MSLGHAPPSLPHSPAFSSDLPGVALLCSPPEVAAFQQQVERSLEAFPCQAATERLACFRTSGTRRNHASFSASRPSRYIPTCIPFLPAQPRWPVPLLRMSHSPGPPSPCTGFASVLCCRTSSTWETSKPPIHQPRLQPHSSRPAGSRMPARCADCWQVQGWGGSCRAARHEARRGRAAAAFKAATTCRNYATINLIYSDWKQGAGGALGC